MSTQIGRVIVFIDAHEPEDAPAAEVIAVPGHWDADDIDRYIKSREDAWVTAAVTTIGAVEEEA